MKKKNWNEFRQTGLLWFINSILHLFGWAIVLSYKDENDDEPTAYPARVPFRGFDEEHNTKGYQMVTHYLKKNIDYLMDEANDERDNMKGV